MNGSSALRPACSKSRGPTDGREGALAGKPPHRLAVEPEPEVAAAGLSPATPLGSRDVEQCQCHAAPGRKQAVEPDAGLGSRTCRRRCSGVTRQARMHFWGQLGVFLQALALLPLQTHGQQKENAPADEVHIEVLHVPKECQPKSKKGDLLNAHYDGYLASDKSKFYCR